MNNGYIRQAWLVIVLAVGFGGALAGVEASLRDRIEANLRALTLDQVEYLVPGADRDKTEDDRINGRAVYRAFDSGGNQVGWLLPATGQGFADKIKLLIGLDAGATQITGLFVLDQKETPGLGNMIVKDEWREQFRHKSTAEAVGYVKATQAGRQGPNDIQALSGATISSRSVCKIVNKAVREMRDPLAAAVRK